jgi:hypothetical protein
MWRVRCFVRWRGGLTAGWQLVYNAAMDVTSALLSAVLATVTQGGSEQPAAAATGAGALAAVTRALPRDAKKGVMQPPAGDGFLTIGSSHLPLAPISRFRNTQNLIVMPMQIQQSVDVLYLTDADGAVSRVWMLTPAEAAAWR